MADMNDTSKLQPDQPAPDFELVDQHGEVHSLSNYRGNWLVLYFYPKNNTPGCTTQACEFRNDYQQFKNLNAYLLGIGVDNSRSHAEFATKYQLPFPLLADNNGHTAKKYRALLNLLIFKFAKRQTFIIDPDGIIRMRYKNIHPKSHSEQVLRDLVTLQSKSRI